jgi:hypothetical protein
MDKILISGCSYTANAEWPTYLWPNASMTNMASSGASNRYISDSITQSIDLKNKPDFVFILWSGLNKLDLVLPVSTLTTELAETFRFYGKINNSYYFFDGGDTYHHTVTQCYERIKDNSWPKVNDLLDFFALTPAIRQQCHNANILPISNYDLDNLEHYLEVAFILYRLYHKQDNKFFNDVSLSAIANCSTFLEHHQIPYRFGFCADVFSKHSAYLQGCIDKTNPNFTRIAWDKYVKLTPYEFGLEYDLMDDDGFHLTTNGMKQWADQIRQFLTKD